MSKLKKTFLIISLSIVALVVLIFLFISPIAKYAIQKYDVKYLGREIGVKWVYLNPFTGYLHLRGLKIYENGSDSLMLTADGLSANFEMFKLFNKTYEIGTCTLTRPRGIIIQNKKVFNFDDLIVLFSPKGERDTTMAPVHFNILDINIVDGEFHYREEQMPINYFIKNVNIESTGKRWDSDTMAITFDLLPGIGTGDMNGACTIDFKTKDFRLAFISHKFDLGLINQYLQDLSNFGSMRANLDADLHASGNFMDQENLTVSGILALNEFHFGKDAEHDLASFDVLNLSVEQVSPKKKVYLIDSISLQHPFFRYEIYDHLDNLQTMFGERGSKITEAAADDAEFNLIIEIARYVKVLAKNFFKSDYRVDRLAVYKADIQFNDYSISERFAIGLDPLTIEADSLDKNNPRVHASLKTAIIPYGNMMAKLSINPRDSSDFDLVYHLQKIPVSLFNPYLITFTSFPLDRGTLEFKGEWNVKSGKIRSVNHLTIIDPRMSKRVRNKDTKWIPIPLIMSLVREIGNVIDYEIPITGDLKDPNFHVADAVFDLLENIFVKPASTPYLITVKNVESNIEKLLSIKWRMRSASLTPAQEKFTQIMADFLLKEPNARISVEPQQYTAKEKEYILYFEAKKQFYFISKNTPSGVLNEDDSTKVDRMSVKDSLFVRYLSQEANDSMLFTIMDKCASLIDAAIIDSLFDRLTTKRKETFLRPFVLVGVEKQLVFWPSKDLIPYNGFSSYSISYNGDLPETLRTASVKMNQLNDEVPRKEFKQARRKNAHWP